MKKIKKLASVIIAMLIVFQAGPISINAQSAFPDVPTWAWYYEYIEKIGSLEIINGYADGTFQPDNPVTRGEFLKMISEAAGLINFSGSPNWGWASQYWQNTMDNHLLLVDAQTQETLFDASVETLAQPINRYEMAVIVSNTTAAKLNNMDGWRATVVSPSNYIPDYSSMPDKYRDAVEQVYGKGIVDGVKDDVTAADGSYCGTQSLTRAQAAKVIYLMLWSGDRTMASFAEEGSAVNFQETTDYTSFAMRYREMSTAQRQLALFGDANKTYFTSASDASGYLTTVEVPCWKIDGTGNKYSATISLMVHTLVAGEVKLIFNEIYNDPERFPISTYGGARFTDKLRHSWGCAIDLNYDENYYCRVVDGVPKALTGSGYWPGSNVYSIPANGSVVRAFAKYGWGWGGQGWSGGYYDYMHFSILSSGG